MTGTQLSDDKIRKLVKELDTTSWTQEDAVWQKLVGLKSRVVPFLAEAYPSTRKWQGRVSVVYHSVRYAREQEEAFQLGLAALSDRSTMVRYRACMLLAWALDERALAPLRALLSHKDQRTVEDAKAAIEAIEKQNHNLFLDRQGSGKVTWNVV